MLVRLVVRLLFKACVPLVAVAGVMSYGVYLKGGDPAGLWKHVASGAFDKAGAMFTQTKDNVVGVAGNLTAGAGASAPGGAESGLTQVFTWKDADGVTHFGSTVPQGIIAQTLSVNPDVNVLAPVAVAYATDESGNAEGSRSRTSRRQSGAGGTDRSQLNQGGASPGEGASSSSQAVQQLEAEMGGPLPGVGGQLLSSGAAGENGINAQQLIRLLQSSGN